MSKAIKKIIEETREQGYTEVDLCDKGIHKLLDVPNLRKYSDLFF